MSVDVSRCQYVTVDLSRFLPLVAASASEFFAAFWASGKYFSKPKERKTRQ